MWAGLIAALLTGTSAPPVFAISETDKIRLLDFSGGESGSFAATSPSQISFSASGLRLAWLESGKLQVGSWKGENRTRTIADGVREYSWSPVGLRLAYLVESKVLVWNAGVPGEPASPVTIQPGKVIGFDWSPDGSRLMIGQESSSGGRLSVVAIEGGNARPICEGHALADLGWSPDGRQFAFLKPVLGKSTLSLVTGRFGSLKLTNHGEVGSGKLQWGPDGRRILVAGAGAAWHWQSGGKVQKFGEGAPLGWAGSNHVLVHQDGKLLRLDLRQQPPKPTPLFDLAQPIQLAMMPGAFLDESGTGTSPFKELPLPRPGQSWARGFVSQVDPYDDSLLLQCSQLTLPDGKEMVFASPLELKLQTDSASQQFGENQVVRAMDFPLDEEIAVLLPIEQPMAGATHKVLRALFPNWEVEEFWSDPNFPKLPQDTAIEHDRVTRAKVKVPLVFPVIGKIWYEDWFLRSRGNGTRRHRGQDLMGDRLLPLVACFDGVATFARGTGNAGYSVTLRNRSGWRAEYYHLNNDSPGTDDGLGGDEFAFAPGLTQGISVKAGELLGWLGDSGNAETTAPHLHFELWYDPLRACINAFDSLKAAKKLVQPTYVDPAPFLKPAEQELRQDGFIRNWNPLNKELAFALSARQTSGRPATPSSYPQSAQLTIGPATKIEHRSNARLGLRPDDLRPGQAVTVLRSASGNLEPRLIAVENR